MMVRAKRSALYSGPNLNEASTQIMSNNQSFSVTELLELRH